MVGTNAITLRGVLHTPHMRHNLISGSRIDAAGYSAMAGNGKYRMFTPKKELFIEAKLREKFYTLNAEVIEASSPLALTIQRTDKEEASKGEEGTSGEEEAASTSGSEREEREESRKAAKPKQMTQVCVHETSSILKTANINT